MNQCIFTESCSYRAPPKHGKVSPDEQAYFVGQRILFSCKKDYYLDGIEENTCQKGGEWQFTRTPRCRKYCFFKRRELDDNLIYSPMQNLYRFGHEVSFTCTSGWDLDGASELRCMDGGRWNQRPPTCGAY